MLFADTLLAKKGPLARVWLAAHWERKLSKAQFLQTNINSSVAAIIDAGAEPMALRLTGQLLLGVVRILSRKARYLLEDCSEALMKIKMVFRPGMVDLTEVQAVATANNITMPESMTEFDILLPEPRINLAALLSQGSPAPVATVSRLQDITLADNTFLSSSQREDMLIEPMSDISAGVEMGRNAPAGAAIDVLDAPSITAASPASVRTSANATTDAPAIMTEQEEPILDLGFGDMPSALEVEVGRDVAAPMSFLPDTSAAADITADTSVTNPDVSKGPTDLTAAPADLGADEGVARPDEPLAQQVGYAGDDNFDFDFGEPLDLGLPVGDAPAVPTGAAGLEPETAENLEEDATFMVPDRPVAKRPGETEEASRKRAATHQRRHRLAIDSEIDMNDAMLQRQIRDTSDIRAPIRQASAWRTADVAAMANAATARTYILSGQEDMPANVSLLVRATDSLRRFEFVERSTPQELPAQSASAGDENELNDQSVQNAADSGMLDVQAASFDEFDPFQGGDFFEQVPEALEPFADVPSAVREASNLEGDDENVDPNLSVHDADQSIAKPGDDDAAPAPNQESLVEISVDVEQHAAEAVDPSYMEVSIDEVAGPRAPSFMRAEPERPRLFDADETESGSATDAPSEAGLSKHTAQTIAILKDTFNNDPDAQSTSYKSIVKNSTRATAARFFFELLVLKNKNYIDVKQPEAYADIEIIPKAALFTATSASS